MNPVRRNVVWKTPSLTADWLKNFACLMMLASNIGIIVVDNGLIGLSQYTQESLSQALADDSRLMALAGIGSVMQLLGGLAMPVFAYLLVEGFLHTSNYRKYLLSIFAFALISEIPYDLSVQWSICDFSSQNALFSMLVCLLMIYFLDMIKARKGILSQVLRLLIVICAVAWVTILRSQYGFSMVLLTAVFFLFYSRNILKTFLGIIISLLYVTGPLAFYAIWCYNDERKNRIPKYAYYIFYPLHLAVLGIVAWMAAKFI